VGSHDHHAHAHEHDDGSPRAGWDDPDQVAEYQRRMDKLEARALGEAALLAELPAAPQRLADLGCGDGRLAATVLEHRPGVGTVVGVDRSPPMLDAARQRFAGDRRVTILEGHLRAGLPPGGPFDVAVSGFAIHHLEDDEKRALFGQLAAGLAPGGTFANLEVVASATPEEHAAFLEAIGRPEGDPEDRLALVDDQLRWMAAAGLVDVRCPWRWQGFAVLVGRAPSR
jgi:tRNA (cmo5U34)-methyltransferase